MNIYRYRQYRQAFAELFRRQRQTSADWSLASLAERIGVRASHLTNVMKDRGDFSSDQIYALGRELKLEDEEVRYLDLLKEWERAGDAGRKEKLADEIRRVRDRNLRSEKELSSEDIKLPAADFDRYYLDPNIELIHLYLGTHDAPTEIATIADEWGLPLEYVADIVSFLRRTGLVDLRRSKWHVPPIHQHLPVSSPIQRPQQILKRLRATEVLQKRRAEHTYAFSAAITMNEETRIQIQARFLDFLKWVESAAIESPPDGIYHMQFDLFPWIEPKRRSSR